MTAALIDRGSLTIARFLFVMAALSLLAFLPPPADAAQMVVQTDTSWRAIGPVGNLEGSPIDHPQATNWENGNVGWNNSLSYDDSNANGWNDAIFNNHANLTGSIWPSGDSFSGPTPVYFRKVIVINGTPTGGRIDWAADDDAIIYVNGNRVVNDGDGLADSGAVNISADLVSGPNLIAVKSHDGQGTEGFGATVTIDFTAAPIAVDDSYQAIPSQPLNVPAPGVLSNDTDADGDPLTAIVVSQPSAGGTLTLNADGSFTYTPPIGFAGADTFTYMADDGTGTTSNAATVTITVISVPIAADDSFQVQTGLSLDVNAPGVLANDSDADNDPLTATLASGPGNAASFAFNPDGSFSYTPATSFTGTDSFTYTAGDGANTSNPATVTIDVTPDPLACMDLLRAPVDAYEALVQSTLAQELPAIEALVAAGDISGAAALQQAAVSTLVQEAANTAVALQAECADCIAQLQSSGNPLLVPSIQSACQAQMHRIGSIQASAVAQLELAVSSGSVNPPRIVTLLGNRYLAAIELVADRSVEGLEVFENRFEYIIRTHVSRGNTAAANSTARTAEAVIQQTAQARIDRIQQLCDNFVDRAATLPGSTALAALVVQAANQAMFDIQLAQSNALLELQAAGAG